MLIASSMSRNVVLLSMTTSFAFARPCSLGTNDQL